MSTLAEASLSAAERRVLDRAVELMTERLGGVLVSVWLYGSRARGEKPHAESDIDLLIVTRGGDSDHRALRNAIFDAANESDFDSGVFSVQVRGPEELVQRREIEDFFIQEVDRDRIVLVGEP